MKKILLTSQKEYFKANLHCHSTISDGRKTPEELKEMYQKEGYSVIAYTDHDVLLDHSDLCDEQFVALNGLEMEINEQGSPWSAVKTCHLCFIALEQSNLQQFCYHRTEYLFGNAVNQRNLIQFDDSKPDFERIYTPDCINEIIAEGRKNGFFVTYNHPAWSLETLENYGQYKGMNAMEICNYGCVEAGYPDYNEKEYDEILRGGQKIFCIAADDNHNIRKDSFGGFTVINAETLSYPSVTKALENGDFYASQGPLISELWFDTETKTLGIQCSEAVSIRLNAGIRRTEITYPEEGKSLTSAVFGVKDTDGYVRITVTDRTGKHANTSAYFVEDLLK